jgi:arabinogalactan oligomer/maltooligosaccharide transport system substrate-binding protein
MDRRKLLLVIPAMLGIVFFLYSCRSGNTATPTAHIITPTATQAPSSTPTLTPIAAEPTATQSPDVEGKISIWIDWTQAEIAAISSILEAFQESFPQVEISLIYFPPDQLEDRFKAAADKGEQPTLIVGDSKMGLALWHEKYIQDISPHLTEGLLQSVRPIAWEGVAVDNTVMGLPLSLEGIVLYRNAELMPASPMTLEELIRASKGLSNQVAAVADVGFLYSGAFLSACDGALMSADGSQALTLKSAECWLRVIAEWREAGPIVLNSEEDLLTFENGQAAWLVDGTWQADRLLSAVGADHLAIDPWPKYASTGKQLAGFAWTRNIYFGSTSAEKDFDAAWVLARYLLTPEVQIQLASAREGRQIPVLADLSFEERWLQELMVALDGNVSLPLYPEFIYFNTYLEQAAYDVARKGYDLLYCAEWAYRKIEQDLAKARSRGE